MYAIKLGSRGSEVRKIQQRLNCRVTGVYNTPTLRAVMAFQQQNNILDNGEVDEYTYGLLFPKSFVQEELQGLQSIISTPTEETPLEEDDTIEE
jgi:peptidoglycan hydrolase-like protein with peptidoglycan-binding domain